MRERACLMSLYFARPFDAAMPRLHARDAALMLTPISLPRVQRCRHELLLLLSTPLFVRCCFFDTIAMPPLHFSPAATPPFIVRAFATIRAADTLRCHTLRCPPLTRCFLFFRCCYHYYCAARFSPAAAPRCRRSALSPMRYDDARPRRREMLMFRRAARHYYAIAAVRLFFR